MRNVKRAFISAVVGLVCVIVYRLLAPTEPSLEDYFVMDSRSAPMVRAIEKRYKRYTRLESYIQKVQDGHKLCKDVLPVGKIK